MEEVLVNCAVIDLSKKSVRRFTVDHHNPGERQYLGKSCQQAFDDNEIVLTWRESPQNNRAMVIAIDIILNSAG